MKLLEGKTALVTGVANEYSIAWAIAQEFILNGAEVVISVQNRKIKGKVKRLDGCPQVYVMNIKKNSSIKKTIERVDRAFGNKGIDCLVHSIAYAPKEELQGRFIDGTRKGALESYSVSSESLRVLAKYAEPYLNYKTSIIYLTSLGSQLVFPNYNIMGPAKAALEATASYLASDLGKSKKIRINGISAGPIRTLAARAIKDLNKSFKIYNDKVPLGWDSKDPENARSVAKTAVFLASNLSEKVTGNIIYIDGGLHNIAI